MFLYNLKLVTFFMTFLNQYFVSSTLTLWTNFFKFYLDFVDLIQDNTLCDLFDLKIVYFFVNCTGGSYIHKTLTLNSMEQFVQQPNTVCVKFITSGTFHKRSLQVVWWPFLRQTTKRFGLQGSCRRWSTNRDGRMQCRGIAI